MNRDGITRDDAALDALFGAARRQTPEPGPDFLARLAADAERSIPERPTKPSSTVSGNRFFTHIAGLFAVSGLTGAAALGVWIGFVMPDVLNSITGSGDGYYLSEFLPSTDLSALGD